MAEQENLRGTATELGEQVIAAIRARQPGDAAAHRLEPRCQLATAPIDGGLVRGRRLEADERFGRVDEPVAPGAAEFLKVVYSGHGPHRGRVDSLDRGLSDCARLCR